MLLQQQLLSEQMPGSTFAAYKSIQQCSQGRQSESWTSPMKSAISASSCLSAISCSARSLWKFSLCARHKPGNQEEPRPISTSFIFIFTK